MQGESMEAERALLDEAFEKARSDLQQVDDVFVIGVTMYPAGAPLYHSPVLKKACFPGLSQ
jgi:hypothetical protein